MKEVVIDIEEVVKAVLFRNKELSNRIAALEAENADLRERLSRFEKPEKDSHNSHIPPGKENLKAQALRRTSSLRTPSGRLPGGQTGRKGVTLPISDTPDVIQFHTPDYCGHCGLSLSAVVQKQIEVRQSIDIPLPVCAVITNHVTMEKVCTCGKSNRGTFPDHVKPGVSYGVNLHAAVAYLNTVQHIPFKRLTETIKHFYGVEMSQGSVSNILNRMRRQSDEGYEAIRRMLEKSPVVGADETGEHLNGVLHWMWVFQNAALTYIFQHPSRGKTAIDEHFPEGLPKSVLVTDRHRSYFNMETAGHQLCLAHLLRELIYLGELDKKQPWSPALLALLRDSIRQRKQKPVEEIDVKSIKERFQELMKQDLSTLGDPFKTLQKSLIKHQEHMFRFLEHTEVPYDNNGSERSIRPLKVKQKVSGMFKSNQGADAFCQLYSIVDTARKNGQNPFKALIAVAENVTNRGP